MLADKIDVRSLLLMAGAGAAWPQISKLLQGRGIPKEQADQIAKQVLLGKAPAEVPAPARVAPSPMGGWMPWIIGAVALGALAFAFTRR